jgi:DNA polymerase-4
MLTDRFGSVGRHIRQLAQGQDDRTVVPDREAKSVSTETTFGQDVGDRDVLRTCLLDLVDHLASRLRQVGLHSRTVDVKIRSSDFRTWTRAVTLAEPTNLTDLLWQAAADLFERSLTREMLPVRLLGVGTARLTRDPVVQRGLFDEETREKQNALDKVVDAIRGQFGTEAIRRGSLLDGRNNRDEKGTGS